MSYVTELKSAVDSLLFGILTIVFVTLKLTNVINWSWWFVLGPLWMPLAVVLVLAVVFFVIGGFIGVFKILKK